MHPDFIAIAMHPITQGGNSPRDVCVEVCAHSFYGKGWCHATPSVLERLIDGFESLGTGGGAFEVVLGPSDRLVISGAPLEPRTVVEVGVGMRYPEGTLSTQFPIRRTLMRDFSLQLRRAWRDGSTQTIELIATE